MQRDSTVGVSRRGLFLAAGAAVVAAGVVGGTIRPAFAEEAASVDQLIKTSMGDGAIKMEKVVLDAPDKAENGSLVRIPISVDHPMTADDYIQSVAIFVDNNPKPLAGSFNFTPEIGAVKFEIRIKMAKASKVRVIAKSNKGILYGAIKEIQVAEGGCAG